MNFPTDDPLPAAMAARLALLFTRDWEALLGPASRQPAIGPFTSAEWAAALSFLALAALTRLLIAAFLRRKIQTARAREASGSELRAFAGLRLPLFCAVWVPGLYAAGLALLPGGPVNPVLASLGRGFDALFDLAVWAGLLWLFFRVTHLLEAVLRRWTAKTSGKLDDLLVPILGRVLRLIVPVVVIILALPLLDLQPAWANLLSKASSILLIIGIALVSGQTVNLLQQAAMARYDLRAADNLNARKIHTQVQVLARTLYFLIGFFSVASILMLFQEVRHLGASLLASAGVVGVILGVAAQKTIANLLAGFQLALAQPIRLDDVVIVQGEWGRVEEITLTYVVIHIWDERRMVVPLAWFIEQPFQNWTRSSAQLVGSVLLWVDYSLPLAETRQAVQRMVEGHPLWDGRSWNLQVSDATERTMQIRVLATAADSSKTWDLRCDLREQIIRYIQEHHPRSLPTVRNSFRPEAGPAAGPPPGQPV